MTLGNEIEELIQEAFSDYDYLEAMLLNSLTNQTLYNACNQLFIKLQKKLEKDKLFLSERQEPGQPGLSMEYQKEIYKVIKKNHPKTVVKIIEGYILQPGKTMSYFYDISDEETSGIDHDCNKCDNQYCTFRQYNIKVTYDGKSKVLQAFKGTNILDFLLENKYPIKDSCKGKGKCGKCIIKIKNHKLGTTKEEESKLSSKQLSKYKVLACMHNVESDLEIDISK
jgi:ferredoxin